MQKKERKKRKTLLTIEKESVWLEAFLKSEGVTFSRYSAVYC